MTTGVDGKLKMIKGIVFFMAGLLLLGMVLLVYGFAFHKDDKKNVKVEAKTASQEPKFETITIKSEDETTVKHMISCGEMLCMTIESGDIENVLIVNPATGKLHGNINFVVEKNK